MVCGIVCINRCPDCTRIWKRDEIPILMVSAGSDKIVSLNAQKSMCSKLKQCQLTVIAGARHEILKETDSIRSVFWEEFDKFIADIVQ